MAASAPEVARRSEGCSGVFVRCRKKVKLLTGPSCAFHVATGACTLLGVASDGSHTATVPSAAAVIRRSGPAGSLLPSGSMPVTAPLCAPASFAYTCTASRAALHAGK